MSGFAIKSFMSCTMLDERQSSHGAIPGTNIPIITVNSSSVIGAMNMLFVEGCVRYDSYIHRLL